MMMQTKEGKTKECVCICMFTAGPGMCVKGSVSVEGYINEIKSGLEQSPGGPLTHFPEASHSVD